MGNILYYGDNLDVLREQVDAETVDLVYLDPPFNSNSNYNILFAAPDGHDSHTKIEAFGDTWHWNDLAERAYEEVMTSGDSSTSDLLTAMRSFLGENDMMAYLTMMAIRLIEIKRVLKSTGSIYLHCDPTSSHYLKILLDGIFGPKNFRNEISWKRSNPKSLGKVNFANCRDVILRYSVSDSFVFNKIFGEHDEKYVESAYKYEDDDGRRYRLLPLLNPSNDRPNLTYEFLGVKRVWRWTKERMQNAYDDGLVVQLKKGAVPQYKLYLDESRGRTITNDWNDIQQVAGNEALGYPTQKPLALLERIVSASTNSGDVVLDPFCGCGTTIHAAQMLDRQWIGIDKTHLAITLIEKRLADTFSKVSFEVLGAPNDLESARILAKTDKYQFQWWASSLVNAVPTGDKKNGSDSGPEGLIYIRPEGRKTEKVIVSVKGEGKVKVAMIRDLARLVEQEKAKIGLFVTLAEPTSSMKKEAKKSSFYKTEYGKYPRIQILTIEQLLAGEEPEIPLIERGAFKRTIPQRTQLQGNLEL